MASGTNLLSTPPPKAPSSALAAAGVYTPSADWKVTPSKPQAVLNVGSTSTAQSLAHLFSTHSIPLDVQRDSAVRFGRDSRVCLLDKTHLLPFQLNMEGYLREKFYSMLPIEEAHFFDDGYSAFGHGFSERNLETAKEDAIQARIRYRWGKTCIEGGNCRIFVGKDGRPKALVGYHSLLLSYLALEQAGYFRDNEERVEKLAHRIDYPQEDSYRVARNLLLTKQQYEKRERYSSKDKILSKPTEPHKYYELALEFEAKLRMTKEKIAEELGIPEDQIAFLTQENFHIDLEVFAGPEDVVFVHDEESAISIIEERQKKGERERPILESYLKNAHSRLDRSLAMRAKNQKAIESIGCRVVRVAGDFIGPQSEHRINFMNGLFLNDRHKPHFITNGTPSTSLNHYIKSEFLERIEAASPQLKVLFVDDQNARLPRSLGDAHGGVNCMTWIGGSTTAD